MAPGAGTVEQVDLMNVYYAGSNFLWNVDTSQYFRGVTPQWPQIVLRTSPKFKDGSGNEWSMSMTITRNNNDSESAEVTLTLLQFGNCMNTFNACVNILACSHGACCQTGLRFNYNPITTAKPFTFKAPTDILCFPPPNQCTMNVNQSEVEGRGFKSRHERIYCQIFVQEDGFPRRIPSTLKWDELLTDEKFSDIKICCSGKSFPAHKGILSVRSSVFRAMFEAELSETKQSSLDLSSFSESVVKGLLEFIYTDKTVTDPQYAEEWLRISDMYNLDDLKFDAGCDIGQKLDSENVVEYFRMAHLYRAKYLLGTTTRFMKRNAPLVSANKTAVKELARADPDLVAELLMAIAGTG